MLCRWNALVRGLQTKVSKPWTRAFCREVPTSASGSHSAKRTEITERMPSQHAAWSCGSGRDRPGNTHIHVDAAFQDEPSLWALI